MTMLHTALGVVAVTPAQPDEVPLVIAILDEAAAWLQSRGIRQWPSPPPPRIWTVMTQAVAQRHVYVARTQRDGDPIGTLRLTWTEPALWPHDPDGAGYVHHLAIRNHVRGYGVGALLLEWAKHHIRGAQKRYIRLDCWGENPALCQYYEQLGFTYCGQVQQGPYLAALYQLEL
jgi:ribosomal protein S18 acetylase RimI-like enzyme